MVEDNHKDKQPPPCPSNPPHPPSSSTLSSLLSQPQPPELTQLPQTQSILTISTTNLVEKQDDENGIQKEVSEKEKKNSLSNSNNDTTTQLSFYKNPLFYSGQKILNDAQVICNRRINFNQKARKCLELTCEEKISKHELEEVHFSMPSSIKSTFIMTFSPDGQKVASTHNDHRIYICDLNTGKLLDTLEGHSKTPWCLAWHPSNKEILASGCLAGEVRVWDLKSKACESWTNENNTIISSIDFHPKERILVIATSNHIHFWDWNDSEPFAKTTTLHDKEKIKYVEFDPSGTKLITGISNLPEFGSFGSDSLQNRIIDSYLTQGTLDQLQTTTSSSSSSSTSSSLSSTTTTTTTTAMDNNMTQNSEILSSTHNNMNNNNISIINNNTTNAFENFNESNVATHNHYNNNNNQLLQNRYLQQSNLNGTSNIISSSEQDMSYRSTLILSRVAFLYRQLEALEDSMRHTSFSPYVSPRPLGSPIEPQLNVNNDDNNNQRREEELSEQQEHQQLDNVDINMITDDPTTNEQQQPKDKPPNKQEASHGNIIEQQPAPLPTSTSTSTTTTTNESTTQQADTAATVYQTTRVPNLLDPIVVSFDESLEHLQLTPLIIDGQIINLATVIEQYPIDFPWHLHYMMQFESMNQVNQNFIRISKLMSSIRLYRQIVQQISTSNSGRGHFQPNQILTAQSTSPRSVRNVTSNLPVVFRNLPVLGNDGNFLNSNRMARPNDPIMAIQFRNTARNVPLATICKIDLLSARSICLWRSQQLVEQALSNLRSSMTTNNNAFNNQSSMRSTTNRQQQQNDNTNNGIQVYPANNQQESTLFYPLVFQLHEALAIINQAPLTTSNVHIHITNLRILIHKLLKILGTLFNSQEEGQRLKKLIHDIANSLTGRSWRIPFGHCLDDIRLDVIHTFCIVDLTLHLTRQVQLLQMQRLSAIVRVEEYKRLRLTRGTSINTGGRDNDTSVERPLLNNNASATTTTTTTTTTTSGGQNGAQSSNNITSEQFYGPSTSRDISNLSSTSRSLITNNSKRKEVPCDEEVELINDEIKSTKKRKVDDDDTLMKSSNTNTNSSSTQMIEITKQQQQLDNTSNISYPRNNQATSTYSASLKSNVNEETQEQSISSVANQTLISSNIMNQQSPLSENVLPTNSNINNNQLPLTEQLQQTDRLVLLNNGNNQNPTPLEQSLQRFLVATASSMNNSHILVRIYSRLNNGQITPIASASSGSGSNVLDTNEQLSSIQTSTTTTSTSPPYESRRRALSQDNSIVMNDNNLTSNDSATTTTNTTSVSSNNNNNTIGNNQFNNNRIRQVHVYPSSSVNFNNNGNDNSSNSLVSFDRHLPHVHVYQTRGAGQHLWFNQWTIPLPISKANYRLQCWNFTMSTIPNIKDSHSNLLTPRCRIHNDSSIDISCDGSMVGCLVPRDDGACVPNFDVKIFSLKIFDFGVCYYKLPHGPNAISVTISPSTSFVVVGLSSNKFISNEPNDDDLIVAKVYKLNSNRSFNYVRDIKTKRDDSTLSLNAIKWMQRGIVYNVGPQHHQRYQTGGRFRNGRNIIAL